MRNVSVLVLTNESVVRAAVADALGTATKAGLLLVESAADARALQRPLHEPFSGVIVSATAAARDGMRCVKDWVDTLHSPAVIVLSPDADTVQHARSLALGAQDVLPWSALRECLAPALARALVRQDVVRSIRAEGRNVAMVMRDPLTGALSCGGLEFLLAEDRAHDNRRRDVSAMFIDCDDLAHVNRTRGRAAGDRVLAEVVGRIRKCLRPHDRIARVGGDEFLVVLPDTGEEHAFALAERMRAAVGGRAIQTLRGAVSATVSIGVFPIHDATIGVDRLRECGATTLRGDATKGANRVARAPGHPSGCSMLRRWPLHVVGADPASMAAREHF